MLKVLIFSTVLILLVFFPLVTTILQAFLRYSKVNRVNSRRGGRSIRLNQ